jgi:hypothetical protein
LDALIDTSTGQLEPIFKTNQSIEKPDINENPLVDLIREVQKFQLFIVNEIQIITNK